MASLHQLIGLVTREETTLTPTLKPSCDSSQETGRLGVRISSIFVIWLGSLAGALFPIVARHYRGSGVLGWVFFIAKYFGSGVIVATAFIHLLAPANQALTNPCLTGPITAYPWVEGIALMTVFALFFVELMALRWATLADEASPRVAVDESGREIEPNLKDVADESGWGQRSNHQPGMDHLGHVRTHTNVDYSAQLTAVAILEFGVIFHSIFIGLTLAVAGSEFNTLYVVLAFHQTFEGLGLGTRLAVAPWPANKPWTPYLLALAYGVSTPIAIAIGLGVRAQIGSRTGLIVNGVFDSISAGILLYTGLVELMAHEFMFNEYMRRASLGVVLPAYGTMCLGAGEYSYVQNHPGGSLD